MSYLGKSDPRTAFPIPPFPAQSQEPPGGSEAMEPVPDSGEQSHAGTSRLAGYRGIVTGADSGIGRAAAIALAKEGADLVLNYLPSEQADAEATARAIEAAGRRAILVAGDLTDETFCAALVERGVRELGGLDTLVLVAGFQKVNTDVAATSTEDFDRTVKVNLYAMFWLVRAAVPHLEPGSTIVTTSSITAHQPSESMIDYAMTKAGIIAYTNGLARQVAAKGIRVNCIVPGPVWTPLQPASYDAEAIAHYGQDTPFGRPAQPVELASAYVYLVGPESSYTSGSTLTVAGATGSAF